MYIVTILMTIKDDTVNVTVKITLEQATKTQRGVEV